jgi:hypothetical protein
VGSVARTVGGQLASAELLIELPGSTGQAQVLYENALAEQAWAAPIGYSAGGFQQVRTVLPFYHCKGDDWAFAMMSFRQLDAARAEVRLSISLAAMAQPGNARGALAIGPCSTFTTSSGPAIGSGAAAAPNYRRDLLPTLIPPAGAQLQVSGGAMGGDYATSEATAETDLSAGQLEAHFAAQLERSGWVKVASGDAGAVAFSSWSLPHEPEWFGMLTIAQTPLPNRYALTVRVETPSPSSGALDHTTWRAQPGAAPGVLIPTNPDLTPQQMAECLSTRPDPAMCMAPPDR